MATRRRRPRIEDDETDAPASRSVRAAVSEAPASAGAGAGAGSGTGAGGVSARASLSVRDRVISALETASGPLTSQALGRMLPSVALDDLASVLEALMAERRVEAYAMRLAPGAPRVAAEEHTYKLVSAEKAARLIDLTAEDLMVLQHIERGSTQGVWVRNIKIATRLQQPQINKILKRLEGRKLIKPVQSVAFKNRRMYMIFDLEPDKALTGGPWYTEQELDLSFVTALRNVCRTMLDRHGPSTPTELLERITETKVADVNLERSHILHILQTLQADGIVDTEHGAFSRARAYTAPARPLFPFSGADAVGSILGISGAAEEDELPVELATDESGGGTALRTTRVLRTGGRSHAMIGLGAAFAARARRSAFMGALSDATFAAGVLDADASDGEGGGGAGAGAGRRPGMTARGSAAAAKVRAAKQLRYDRMEAEAAGRDDPIDIEDADDDEDPRYRIVRLGAGANGFAHSPCGVCPVAEKCRPSGLISPATCVYLSAWLSN